MNVFSSFSPTLLVEPLSSFAISSPVIKIPGLPCRTCPECCSCPIKVGMMCSIMRNFSVDRGLVKNARVVITNVGTHLLTIRLLHPDSQQRQYCRRHLAASHHLHVSTRIWAYATQTAICSTSIRNNIQQLSRTDTRPHGSRLDKTSLLTWTTLHSFVPNSKSPAWNGLTTRRESQYSKCHVLWITCLDTPQNTPNVTFHQ